MDNTALVLCNSQLKIYKLFAADLEVRIRREILILIFWITFGKRFSSYLQNVVERRYSPHKIVRSEVEFDIFLNV